MKGQMSAPRCFDRSPFRSPAFDTVTGVLVAFVLWGLRAAQSQAAAPQISDAVVWLVAIPVAVWFFVFLVHWEIRAVLGQGETAQSYPRITRLHYSRLAGSQHAIVLVMIAMSYRIIEELLRAGPWLR